MSSNLVKENETKLRKNNLTRTFKITRAMVFGGSAEVNDTLSKVEIVKFDKA